MKDITYHSQYPITLHLGFKAGQLTAHSVDHIMRQRVQRHEYRLHLKALLLIHAQCLFGLHQRLKSQRQLYATFKDLIHHNFVMTILLFAWLNVYKELYANWHVPPNQRVSCHSVA